MLPRTILPKMVRTGSGGVIMDVALFAGITLIGRHVGYVSDAGHTLLMQSSTWGTTGAWVTQDAGEVT
jgi:hypothetical protein